MKKDEVKVVETRNTEERFTTSELKKMINKFTVSRVLKTWTEEFIDEDTSEVVPIERNEVIFERGTLIDRDILAQLQFHMECGDVKEVEVSNQRRVAYLLENTYLRPFMAVADISNKKTKFIFYATTLTTALLLLKDYIELNYMSGFVLTSIREFDTGIILIDNLKKEIQGDNPDNEDGENNDDQKKFYQIDFNVEVEGQQISTNSAIVQTYNVDRGMMLINDYLIKNEKRRSQEAKENKREYTEQEYTTTIESAKPIPVGVYIPKEFSMAYSNE